MPYLKDINGVPTEAPESIVIADTTYPAFNQNVEAMLANGYKHYDDADYSAYKIGQKLFINGEFVINPDYEVEQAEIEKSAKKSELLKEIDELEKTQMRSIREIALNKSVEFSMGKLQLIDKKISELRTQIAGL